MYSRSKSRRPPENEKSKSKTKSQKGPFFLPALPFLPFWQLILILIVIDSYAQFELTIVQRTVKTVEQNQNRTNPFKGGELRFCTDRSKFRFKLTFLKNWFDEKYLTVPKCDLEIGILMTCVTLVESRLRAGHNCNACKNISRKSDTNCF